MNLTIKSYMKILDASPDKRTDYDKRYETIADQISAKWFSCNGHIVSHIRIPSEKTSKVSYDVLLEFTVGVSTTLKEFVNSRVSVFSNCPSFVFSNAKFCYEHGMGIGWARTLLNQATLDAKKDEDVNESSKEPQTSIKCEKSLYFAMKYLLGLNAIELFTALNGANKVHSPSAILMHIRNAEIKGMENFGYGQGYKYPHDYPGHVVEQQYLPDKMLGTKYYIKDENID